jgi:hypothetical protein
MRGWDGIATGYELDGRISITGRVTRLRAHTSSEACTAFYPVGPGGFFHG